MIIKTITVKSGKNFLLINSIVKDYRNSTVGKILVLHIVHPILISQHSKWSLELVDWYDTYGKQYRNFAKT